MSTNPPGIGSTFEISKPFPDGVHCMKNSNKHSLYDLYKNLFTGTQEVEAGGSEA